MDTEEITRSVAAAGFIFRGSIIHDWKGEAPAVPPEAGEIVATRIEEVVRSTPVLRGLAGQEALVVTRHAGALRQLERPILFTEVVSLGKQFLLRDVGHVEAGGETTRQVAAAIREADERPLRERIAAADLIVVGDVIESRAVEDPTLQHSEHDPIWWVARVNATAVLKGRKPRGEIQVLFANSRDHAWFASPKLHPPASGILLLFRVKVDEVPKAVPRTAYQATDPLDFHPLDRREDIERHVGGKGGR
jgi:hypothetical protein